MGEVSGSRTPERNINNLCLLSQLWLITDLGLREVSSIKSCFNFFFLSNIGTNIYQLVLELNIGLWILHLEDDSKVERRLIGC